MDLTPADQFPDSGKWWDDRLPPELREDSEGVYACCYPGCAEIGNYRLVPAGQEPLNGRYMLHREDHIVCWDHINTICAPLSENEQLDTCVCPACRERMLGYCESGDCPAVKASVRSGSNDTTIKLPENIPTKTLPTGTKLWFLDVHVPANFSEGHAWFSKTTLRDITTVLAWKIVRSKEGNMELLLHEYQTTRPLKLIHLSREFTYRDLAAKVGLELKESFGLVEKEPLAKLLGSTSIDGWFATPQADEDPGMIGIEIMLTKPKEVTECTGTLSMLKFFRQELSKLSKDQQDEMMGMILDDLDAGDKALHFLCDEIGFLRGLIDPHE